MWSYYVLKNIAYNISQYVGGLYFVVSLKFNLDRIVTLLLTLPIISQWASAKMRNEL